MIEPALYRSCPSSGSALHLSPIRHLAHALFTPECSELTLGCQGVYIMGVTGSELESCAWMQHRLQVCVRSVALPT